MEAGPKRAAVPSTPFAGRSRRWVSPARLWRALAAEAAAQGPRWTLWTPAAFGVGCAVYFSAGVEPPGALAIAAGIGGVAAGVAALRGWGGRAGAAGLMLLACALLGYADGKLVTEASRAPVLPEGLGVVRTVGRVLDISDVDGGRLRLLIRPAQIEGLTAQRLPATLRITLREAADVEPGDAISLRAILNPPPGPASPGGFDFARDAWFSRLGGVGLALTRARPVALPPPDWPTRLLCGLNALRWRLAERPAFALGGGPAAGLAAAVSTSHQAWLGEQQAQDLRDAGLAHMLAIAGLHTAAVTGFVYLAVRLAIAAWPWAALRLSGKKAAAAAGLLACVVYLALSGAHPPARRAAVTAGVAYLAVLTGRRAISMRSLALAALIVLALQPVAIVQPGFQMSFCATAALVAMAEAWPRRRERIEAPWFIAWPQHVSEWALGMGMVSLVAGLATAPFALQHFNRMATYGLFANFAADLVASAVLMPALVICGLGAAAGLPPALLAAPRALVEWAAQAILAIAHLFATLPGAVRTLPSAPAPALALAFCGIVFACLWRGRLRWVAAPLCAAVLVWPRPDPPAAWVAADGDNAAVVEDGRAVVLKPAVRAFASGAWLTREGLERPFDPEAEAALAFDCDRMGCLPRLGTHPALGAWWGRRAVPPERLEALCLASEIVVVRGPPPARDACRGAVMLTRDDFDRGGSAEIYPAAEGWRVVWAQRFRGERPWSLPPPVAAPTPTERR